MINHKYILNNHLILKISALSLCVCMRIDENLCVHLLLSNRPYNMHYVE